LHPVHAASQPACSAPPLAINLSGFQSALQPARGADRLGQEYVLPSDATLAYFKARGFATIRLPMLWERMQPGAARWMRTSWPSCAPF
jgi:endoglucanase